MSHVNTWLPISNRYSSNNREGVVNGWKELLKLSNFATVVEFWSISKSNHANNSWGMCYVVIANCILGTVYHIAGNIFFGGGGGNFLDHKKFKQFLTIGPFMLTFGHLKGEKNRFFSYNFLTEDYNL